MDLWAGPWIFEKGKIKAKRTTAWSLPHDQDDHSRRSFETYDWSRTFQPRRLLCDRIVFSAERGMRPARQRESDHLALDAGKEGGFSLCRDFLPFCLLIGYDRLGALMVVNRR